MNNTNLSNEWKLETRISELLLLLGADVKLQGFQLAVSAVKYILQNKTKHICFQNDVYPAVAELFHTTVGKVDRNVRAFIAKIWSKKKAAAITRFFGAYHPYDIPSNKQFLFFIAEKLSAEFLYLKDGTLVCFSDLPVSPLPA